MKKWGKPQILTLGVENTFNEDCMWIDTGETLGLGNEEYKDPNVKPEQHQDWVWCTKHNRWHPKDHNNGGCVGPEIPGHS